MKLILGCCVIASASASASAIAIAIAVALPVVAQAQTSDSKAGVELEEVIVTAEKREANVQKTAIAIDVLSAEKLARNGVSDIAQLQSVVPGVQFAQANSSTIVTVRGVSSRDTTELGDPAIAINVDGIFMQRPGGMNAAFFDLDRVEVLRGPQGTLYGRNATGGVVNIISKRPEFSFGGYAALTLGNYKTINGEGAINIPLSDTLALRASFISRQHDGYRNVSIPAVVDPSLNIPGTGSAANRANVRGDDEDSKGARLQLLFKPSDRFSALVSGSYIRQSGLGPVQAGYPTTRPAAPTGAAEVSTVPLSEPGDFKLIRKSLSSQFDYDFGPATATYLVGYVAVDRDHLFDNDGTSTRFYVFRAGEYSKDTSHELRLASNGEGPFTWQVGGYLYDHNDLVRSLNFVNPSGSPIILRNFLFDVDITSKALFGQVAYSLTDALKISAGLRSSHDTKTRGGGRYAGPGLVTPPVTQPVLTYIPETAASRSTDKDVSYHFGVDYQISPSSLLYAKTDKGYKSGGFTSLNAYGPEEVIAYEIGSKNRFIDNQLQLNLSAFLYDYKDQQVSTVTTNGVLTLNAGTSTVKGIEAQVDWRVTPNDSLDLSVNWLDAKFKNFAVAVAGVNVSQKGHRLIQAPELALAAGYEHSFDLGSGKLTPRAQALYRSESFFSVFNNLNDRQAPYTTLDLSLTYAAPNKAWSLQAYARNVTDTVVLTGASIGSFTNTNVYQFGAPRTVGVRLQADF
jgi:iron complex outermembrane recepter protein